MQPISLKTPYRFFAAANGESGFRSYFDDIFSSEEHSAVFILKGGPGTGKSTFLKKVAKAFERPDIQVELYYCSSDPSSLDGVVLTNKSAKVCLLDGTAPHERDARLPGASDILVNLGEGFDEELLRKRKHDILQLQRKKSAAYKDAYFNLGLFGVFNDKIRAEYKKSLKAPMLKNWISDAFLKKESSQSVGCFRPRLISSFSKDGLLSLDSYEKISNEQMYFKGTAEACGLLLHEMLSILRECGYEGFFAPSPFNEEWIDGLFLNDASLSVLRSGEKNEGAIDADRFFLPFSSADAERIRKYENERNRFLSSARELLKEASDAHFALESIYTPAMKFERIDEIQSEVTNKIALLFGD